MLVQAVRRNAKKQTAPQIIVIDTYGGREPFVVWSLSHRAPTPSEIAAAIAEYKRERSTYVEPGTLKPAQGSGDEETK